MEKLRWQGKSRLQRTFSWSNKSKRSKKRGDGTVKKSKADILAAAGVDDEKPKKAVRRSMSFDRLTSKFT